MLNARSFMAFFTLKKKRLAGWENPEPLKSRRHTSPVLYSGCVGVQCQQAACVGCAAELGAGHHPLLQVTRTQTATPAHPGPSRSSHGSSPHTQHLSPWSHSALALRQSRSLHGLVTSLVVTNLTNVSMLWMCSRTPSQSGLTKSG